MIQPLNTRQFLIFLITGGVAAAINFASRILYNQWFSFSISVVLAFITGLVTGFTLIKFFVFKESEQSAYKSAFFYILVNLFALLQTWFISLGLAYYLLPFLGITYFIHEFSHAMGVVIPVITSYIGHKRWSFR